MIRIDHISMDNCFMLSTSELEFVEVMTGHR